VPTTGFSLFSSSDIQHIQEASTAAESSRKTSDFQAGSLTTILQQALVSEDQD